MPVNDLNMVFTGERICFTGLSGHITNVELISTAGTQGLHQIRHQQVRHQTGVQTTRPNDDEICAQ
ncbi:hypothetical protein SDC9_114178 [bioreactor metagenome]|uniref:Uncharacterized protein n=1 Tax=bioreactor metagenome TaxID=1076179 RepID=A0A645BPE7_9ZZZZ